MRALCSFLVLLTLSASAAGAQPAERASSEVRAVIDRLFDGMRAGDSTMVRSVFAPKARLMTVAGASGVRQTPLDRFVTAAGRPHEQTWDERIWDIEIRVDGPLATAWTPYAFYLGDTLSHCGTNAFQLAKLKDDWKIIQITDTRRKDCDVPERVKQDS